MPVELEGLAHGPKHARWEVVALGTVLAAFAVAVARTIAVDAPLEYDEVVYAEKADRWANGGWATGWFEHRAPGLPALALPIAMATRAAWAFRVIGLVSGLVAIVAVWGLARAIGGSRAGFIGGAMFAATPFVLFRSAHFLTDLPAVAMLTLTAFVLWRELELNETPGRPLLLAGPLAASAFWFRFGSAPAIAALAIVAIILWRGTLASHLRLALGSLGLGALLLVPYAVHSIVSYGTPWGALTYTTRFAASTARTDALARYVRWFPTTLAGPFGGALMIAGLAGAAWVCARAMRARAFGRDARAAVFLVVPALVTIVAIGRSGPPDPRYVLFPSALLLVAGAVVLGRLRVPRGVSIAGTAVLVAAFASGAGWTLHHTEKAKEQREELVRIARAIPPSEACVVIAADFPVMAWYSGCEGLPAEDPAVVLQWAAGLGDEHFLVLIPARYGDPVGDRRAAWLAAADDEPLARVGNGGFVYRIRLD